jgi:transposase-like protein
MKRSRFSEEQIIWVLKEHELGASAAELGRRHGISPQTLYNWKNLWSAPVGKLFLRMNQVVCINLSGL